MPLTSNIVDVQLDAADGDSVKISDGLGNFATVSPSGALSVIDTPIPNPSTATITNIPVSISSVTLSAANSLRKKLLIQNFTTKSNLFIKFGATASTTSFSVYLVSKAYYEVPAPVYTGRIDGIWDIADASGKVLITEITS